MIRLERILLPTDFSEFAAPAVEYACEFAKRFGAELHLLHVIEEAAPLVLPEAGATGWVRDYAERAEKWARAQLAGMPGDLAAGVRVVRATRQGPAFLEIIRYAREKGCDLIVMGTHGRSGLAHVLMGSVAERVVRKAPCPVLTIRPEGHRFVVP